MGRKMGEFPYKKEKRGKELKNKENERRMLCEWWMKNCVSGNDMMCDCWCDVCVETPEKNMKRKERKKNWELLEGNREK